MVHVHDPRVRWSVRSAQVARIISARDSFRPPVDVFAALGGSDEHADHRRVVVVRLASGDEVSVLAAGPIDVNDVDSANVLPLPDLLAGSAPHVAGIVVAHDASLSLLLELSAVPGLEDSRAW